MVLRMENNAHWYLPAVTDPTVEEGGPPPINISPEKRIFCSIFYTIYLTCQDNQDTLRG